jgi:hypothetical protein
LHTNDIIYEDDIGSTKIPFTKDGDSLLIRISDRNYLSCDLSREEVIAAFEQATLID